MAFVDKRDEVLAEKVEQRIRRLPGLSAVEVARIVFDSAAISHFPYHLDVVVDSLVYALRLDEFASLHEVLDSLLLVEHNAAQNGFLIAAYDVLRCREYEGMFEFAEHLGGRAVDFANALDRISEHFNADCHFRTR